MPHRDWPLKLQNASANGGVVHSLCGNAGQRIRKSRLSPLQGANNQNFSVSVTVSRTKEHGKSRMSISTMGQMKNLLLSMTNSLFSILESK